MWMQGCIYLFIHSHGTRKKVGWLVLRSAAFTPDTHFIVGWVDPRSGLDTKRWRKSPPLWTRAVKHVAKRLASWATWPPKKPSLEYNHLFSTLKKRIFIVTSHRELMLSLVSAKLRCPPPSLSHKKKPLRFWVRKASSIFGLKSYNFGACICTCLVLYPSPPALVRNTKDRFCYLWSASWGVFSLQRRGHHSYAPNPAAASKFRQTEINVRKIPLKCKMFKLE